MFLILSASERDSLGLVFHSEDNLQRGKLFGGGGGGENRVKGAKP